MSKLIRYVLQVVALVAGALFLPSGRTHADTIVELRCGAGITVGADFVDYIRIKLYDSAAPLTVGNFLDYVNSGKYDGTIIHRSVSGFIIQGGGFDIVTNGTSITGLSPVVTSAPILNEFSPTRSNIRGTIAMAKVGGNPNSATSQWFINLGDNSANLDNQNGGFTVFGEVIGSSMSLVDAISGLPTFNLNSFFDPNYAAAVAADPVNGPLSGPFTDVPLYNNNSSLFVINQAVVVPEPSTAMLLLLGGMGLSLRRKR